MRRRLYFIIPTIIEANKLFNKLLLKRIPIGHIYFMAKDDVNLQDLPEATLMQKFDIMHSLLVGIGIGAIIGIVGGLIGHGVLSIPIGGGMLATTLIGAILGGWSASMIGLMVPNRNLKKFQADIDKGKILMIVDVPKERVKEIEEFTNKIVPTAHYQGVEPTIPGFP